MPTSPQKLFREAALERLSSPDQLDRLVTLTRPRAWIAVLTIGVLLAAVTAWGFLGRSPTLVDSRGIIMPVDGDLTYAVSYGGGTLEALHVAPGDSIEAGQVVAAVLHQARIQRLENKRSALAQMQAEVTRDRERADRERLSLRESIAARRREYDITREVSLARMEYLQSRLDRLEPGIGTTIDLHEWEALRDELGVRRQTLEAARASLLQTEAAVREQRTGIERRLHAAERELELMSGELVAMETEVRQESRVVAPAAGRVTELLARPGARLETGQPLAVIATGDHELEVLLYVPYAYAKKLAADMPARISPHAVRREEYGSLRGTVIHVSAYPLSSEALRARLASEVLAGTLTGGVAVHEARVRLDPAPTPSGFAWTSGTGPPVRLTPGTTVEARIVVRERRPVDLIIPFLRAQVGTSL